MNRYHILIIIFLTIQSNKFTLADPEDLSKLKFVYYYGPNITDNEIFNVEESWKILKHPSFNNSKITTCYVHGYTEDQNAESLQTIVRAYLKRMTDYNIITLDWSKLAGGRYIANAVKHAVLMSDSIAEVFNRFFDYGLNLEKFHLVGHSLGAHVSGFIGRKIQEMSKGERKLSRITALDPAFPGFYIISLRKAVNSNDAEFVDVIHTDGWIYGGPLSTGTVDFWPNRGDLTQPGCPKRDFKILTQNDLCSHRQSWRYWAESVANDYSIEFIAAKAINWRDFRIRSQFVRLPLATMGLDCPTNVTGNYYLQTNHKPPFARGFSGAIFNSKNILNILQKNNFLKFRINYDDYQ